LYHQNDLIQAVAKAQRNTVVGLHIPGKLESVSLLPMHVLFQHVREQARP
jgi:hypothetical protein